MRRPALITLAALGGLVCLIGGTGLFAALTDTARSGTNSVESAPLAGSADIQLARAGIVNGEFTCGDFSEDLTTGFFTVTSVAPSDTYSAGEPYCLRNVGSQSVSVSAMVDELSDVDLACTGDEAAHGDTTCGNAAAGELSGRIRVAYFEYECTDLNNLVQRGNPTLAEGATTPVAIDGALGSGESGCFSLQLEHQGGTGPESQRAQSDRVTWRFKWTAQA